MSFDRALERIIGPGGHEGVYSNDPQDPGNWTGGKVGVGQLKGTKYGISAAAYPDLPIEILTRQDAARIYRRDYWDRCHCDEWPEPLDEAVFDMAVNQGQGAAIRCLQRAAGVTADGIVGPKTIAAVKRADLHDLVRDFFVWRAINYAEIAVKNPANWERHKLGWLRREHEEYEQAVLALARKLAPPEPEPEPAPAAAVAAPGAGGSGFWDRLRSIF